MRPGRGGGGRVGRRSRPGRADRSVDRGRPGRARRAGGRALRRRRRAGQQRRHGQGGRAGRHARRGLAGGARLHPVSRGARVAGGGAAHDPPRRRLDRADRVDLRPRGRRPAHLQRGEGGGDQPGQGAGPRAGAEEHPRQHDRPRLHPVPGRLLAPAPAGRSGRHRRLRRARAAVRPLRPGRGSRRRGGVARLAARELGQRRVHYRSTAARAGRTSDVRIGSKQRPTRCSCRGSWSCCSGPACS